MNRLRECRERANLSQKYVALCLGIKAPSVCNWEAGKTRPSNENIEKLADLYHVSADYLLGITDTVIRGIVNISDALPHRVPLLGSVAAGVPILAEENYDVYVDAPEKADFALTIEGDSMEPLYLNGDIVYIRQVPEVNDGEIAVVLIDDSATLKRVFRQKDGVQLVPENRKYPPMFMGAEHDTIEIIGVPVGYTRMYNNGRN